MKKNAFFLPFLSITLCFFLTACGFHLRNQVDINPKFKSLRLLPENRKDPLYKLISRSLVQNHVTLIPAEQQGIPTLHIHEQTYEDRVLSYAADGRPNRTELTFTLTYSVTSHEGRPLAEHQKIALIRTMSLNPSQRLGMDTERETILQELRLDAVSQLLHRLSVL